jgi:hypothetical protein
MHKLVTDRVDLDILCIVNVHKLLVDIRAFRPALVKMWIIFTRLVANLRFAMTNG